MRLGRRVIVLKKAIDDYLRVDLALFRGRENLERDGSGAFEGFVRGYLMNKAINFRSCTRAASRLLQDF